MQEWLLDKEIKFDDIPFINECGIRYLISDPELLGLTDSGWCDYDTGHRIPTKTMRLTFMVEDDKDLAILKLKFDNHLIRT